MSATAGLDCSAVEVQARILAAQYVAALARCCSAHANPAPPPPWPHAGFSAIVAGMLLFFAARKYTQPVYADIGGAC